MNTAASAELSRGIFLDIESTLSGDIFEFGYVLEGESAGMLRVKKASKEYPDLYYLCTSHSL